MKKFEDITSRQSVGIHCLTKAFLIQPPPAARLISLAQRAGGFLRPIGLYFRSYILENLHL